MRKLKVVFLAAVAAMALTVVASATASAHEYKIEGTAVGGTTALKNISETGTTNRLHGTPFGVSTTIQCTTRVGENVAIGAGGASEVVLKFSSCTVEKPANCTVAEPVVTNVTGALVEIGGALENEFSPVSPPTFTEITLEGASCSIKNKPFKVEGNQACELPSAGTESVSHTLACKTSGSKLKAGGKEATFESSAATLELAGANEGKKFSAV